MHREGLPQICTAEELQSETETKQRQSAKACLICAAIALTVVGGTLIAAGVQ